MDVRTGTVLHKKNFWREIKITDETLQNQISCIIFATQKTKGALSEWLGAGLQNRIRRFDSARHLSEMDIQIQISISFYFYNIDCSEEIMGLVDKRKRQIAGTTSQRRLYLCLNIIYLEVDFQKCKVVLSVDMLSLQRLFYFIARYREEFL